MDLRWQMVVLKMRAKRFLKNIERKFSMNGNETLGLIRPRWIVATTTKGDALLGSAELQEVKIPSTRKAKEGCVCGNSYFNSFENTKILKEQNEQLLKDLRRSKINAITYRTGLESVEARLLVFQKNKPVYEEDIKLLKCEIHLREVAITELRWKLELAQKQKDKIQLTVEKFENSSKNLSKLIYCQIVDKCKISLGYNAIPPPYTGNFFPPKPNLSGLEEFVNDPIVSEPIVKKPAVKTSEVKASEVKASADKPMVVKKPRQNNHRPRGNQRNWNNMMSQRLGSNPQMDLHDKGVIDSGSRCMTENMSYLIDYVEIDQGYVAIRGNLKEGKITGKGNPQMDLHDKGVIDSGSRRMTENMSYLIDYVEIDQGYVAIGGNPKEGKITGKGKFDGKNDEGFFVGYSLNSKAFRVFNNRTSIVEENLHIRFSGNTPNIAGSGPNWLFDIDALTKLMYYKPLVVGNQSNGKAGTKACDDIEMPALEDISTFNFSSNHEDDDEVADMNNLDSTIQVSPIATTRIHKDHPLD
nr:ribonuclease H-like domain-containing protein [Tanacetum cinerariifolium]